MHCLVSCAKATTGVTGSGIGCIQGASRTTLLDQPLEKCRWLYSHFLERRKNAREWYGDFPVQRRAAEHTPGIEMEERMAQFSPAFAVAPFVTCCRASSFLSAGLFAMFLTLRSSKTMRLRSGESGREIPEPGSAFSDEPLVSAIHWRRICSWAGVARKRLPVCMGRGYLKAETEIKTVRLIPFGLWTGNGPGGQEFRWELRNFDLSGSASYNGALI